MIKIMKLRLIFGSCLLSLSLIAARAQSGYEITVTLKGLRDTTCVLGHYNQSRTSFISKDTARVDANGKMIFSGESLPGGIYLILLPGNAKWAEMVYSGKEPRFSMTSDTSDIIDHMVVANSKENEFFYSFQQTLNKQMEKLGKMADKNAPDAVKLREDMETYRKESIQKHPELLASKFLKAIEGPQVPPAPKLPNGKDDSTWVFNYYKNHYWDQIDFNDDRLLRTPILHPKMEQYVKNLVVQTPDSLIKEAEALINRSKNKDFRHYLIRYFAAEYENPKTVGTEAVFVHMAEKYYLGGEISLSEDGRRRIGERVNVLKPLLVGKVFPDIQVWDPQKKPLSLGPQSAKYFVIFFYSPTCGHCKESAPKLLEFARKRKAEQVKVLAVATENSEEEWKKFIAEQKTGDLINGYDFSGQIDFRNKFDVLSTPTVYVLDENKRIIARKMPVEQLDDFLGFYQRRSRK